MTFNDITNFEIFREWVFWFKTSPENNGLINSLVITQWILLKLWTKSSSNMLKSCFYGDLSPSLAEDILIKQKSKSFLVGQCDRDPSKLILSVYKDGKNTLLTLEQRVITGDMSRTDLRTQLMLWRSCCPLMIVCSQMKWHLIECCSWMLHK